ncbi:hypothetical protein B0H34DRAFT_230861 [Crassisporium funariophilum]|nr:hypothetical protein B0H34DRAFT_230861 [Crassisporium funariophilum]
MDYTPRYQQPFTLAEAIGLDVSVISEEISRLQNSLKYLKETQELLRESLLVFGDPDPELTEAYEDNHGSQEERITILKMALTEKGIVAGSHYDVPALQAATPSQAPPSSEVRDNGESGVYL